MPLHNSDASKLDRQNGDDSDIDNPVAMTVKTVITAVEYLVYEDFEGVL